MLKMTAVHTAVLAWKLFEQFLLLYLPTKLQRLGDDNLVKCPV